MKSAVLLLQESVDFSSPAAYRVHPADEAGGAGPQPQRPRSHRGRYLLGPAQPPGTGFITSLQPDFTVFN